MRRSYSAAGTFSLSLSRLDIEKPPGDIHRWRRTNLVVTGLWLLAFVQSPGKGKTGRPAQDNRRFINAVFWILRTGAPWRDLPPDYGDWKNTHRRFCRWRDRNVWAGLLEAVMDDPDYEWLMLDASYIKAHPHSAGARGGNQAIARTKGGSTASCTWRWTPTECR